MKSRQIRLHHQHLLSVGFTSQRAADRDVSKQFTQHQQQEQEQDHRHDDDVVTDAHADLEPTAMVTN